MFFYYKLAAYNFNDMKQEQTKCLEVNQALQLSAAKSNSFKKSLVYRICQP